MTLADTMSAHWDGASPPGTPNPARLLVVEDDEAHVELLRRAWESAAHPVTFDVVRTRAEASERLANGAPDVILTDFILPDGSGLDLLPLATRAGCPLVLMTSQGDEAVAVEALRGGAADYIVKTPATLDAMPSTVSRVLREHTLMVSHARAEAALRASEERLRATLESLGDIVLGVDEKGIVRDAHVPEALAAIVGEPKVGGALDDLIPPSIVAEVRRLSEAAAHATTHQTPELGFDRGDHSFVVRICPRRGGGATVLIRNDTARRIAERGREELEAQLRQTQRLETIGTLTGGIAHDFNNLLVPVLIGAELAQREIPEGSPARAAVDQMITASLQARELVRRLLMFSQHADSAKVPVVLRRVVDDALQLARAAVPTTTEIDIQLDRSAGVVLADSTQMHQVVLNLVLNAHQALPPEGGRVEVTLDAVTLEAQPSVPGASAPPPGMYARLVVRDHGQGMPPDVLERVFEPFFTTKAPGAGTGLGLSVVHGIVRSHGGMIRAKSAPGEGSTFEVLLPRIGGDEPTTGRQASVPRGRGESILMVDDQPAVVVAQARLIERLGYRCTTLTNPAEALARVLAAPKEFDLIITDLTMPELTGVQLAHRLRAAGVQAPIVLLSGSWSTEGDFEVGLFDAVLPKPCDAVTMATRLRAVLDAC
ncbi:MAG: response regulator [Myxococcales bacterium]|nr:response regulator [Myxococcales bacterium]